MLGGMQVDHELRQGAMQAGDRAAHEGEARAGKLGGGLEIQPAVPFTEGDMVLYLEIEGLRRAPATHFDVGVLVGTDRHRLVRQVGNAQQHGIQFALDGVQLALAFLQLEPMRSTSASSGAMSSPRCLAWPIALERALRSACSCSVRVCTDLRCSSSASMRATSSWKPRVARRAATSCGWVRTSLGSSMLFSRLVSVIGGSWPGWRFAGPGDVIDAVAEAWLAPPSPYRSGFSALAGTGAIQLGQVFQLVADLQFQALDTG